MNSRSMKRLSVTAAAVLVLMMVLPRGMSAREVSISPLALCDPDCTSLDDFTEIADPRNCSNFYVCIQGQPDGPIPCDPGNIFDPAEQSCSGGSGCTPMCGGKDPNCTMTCGGAGTFAADPFDCSSYYVCDAAGPAGLIVCDGSSGSYFDSVTNTCSFDESVCCSPYCSAECSGVDELVPDPRDCSAYYICLDTAPVGPPDDKYHMPCDDGMIFNITAGGCKEGDPSSCTTLCDATGGGGSTTSTTSTTTTSSGGGGSDTTTTTTTSTTTTTTTSTTSTDGCMDSFPCEEEGLFAACQTCVSQYFDCSGPGVEGQLKYCNDPDVFNPVEDHGYCLHPDRCPALPLDA